MYGVWWQKKKELGASFAISKNKTHRHVNHGHLLVKSLKISQKSGLQDPLQKIVLQIITVVAVPCGHVGNIFPLAKSAEQKRSE
jgi:hypothetical protein